MDIQKVESLKRIHGWVRYSTKHLFWSEDDAPVTPGQGIYNSNDIGFYSADQVALRKKVAIERAGGDASEYELDPDLEERFNRPKSPNGTEVSYTMTEEDEALFKSWV